MSHEVEIQEMVTNDFTITRLSLALDKLYGLPVGRYKLIQYTEARDDHSITAHIHLAHEKTNVTIELSGPRFEGRATWGLKVGQKYVQDTRGEDGTRLVKIQGYLKPQ